MASGRQGAERGASTVEYILLVGFVAVIVISAVKVIGGHSSSTLSAAAPIIGGTDTPTADTGTGSATDGGGGGGAGGAATTPDDTTPSTTPTTTAPTPTVPPATTVPTTSPPATSPPTTLPPVASQGSAQLTAPTTSAFFTVWWGTSELIVTDDLGAPVSGAHVTITESAYTKGSNGHWSWVTSTDTVTADGNGSVSLLAGPYKWMSGTNQVTSATMTVTTVVLPNGLTWDGTKPSITLNSP